MLFKANKFSILLISKKTKINWKLSFFVDLFNIFFEIIILLIFNYLNLHSTHIDFLYFLEWPSSLIQADIDSKRITLNDLLFSSSKLMKKLKQQRVDYFHIKKLNSKEKINIKRRLFFPLPSPSSTLSIRSQIISKSKNKIRIDLIHFLILHQKCYLESKAYLLRRWTFQNNEGTTLMMVVNYHSLNIVCSFSLETKK